ncbi:MAG: C45 family peptidase, partial [Bacteroidales bacterium]
MRKRWRKIFKRLIISLAVVLLLIIAFLIYFNIAVRITPPVPDNTDILKYKRTTLGKDFYVCKNNWLRKNKAGLWEMYVEGKPFEMGVMNGLLTKDLIYLQEKAFVNEIKKMIPSDKYLKFLKYFVAWFNRNIDNYVEKEYQLEILGISQSVSDEFSDVGPAYQRILNYHAAHDIGHALQNLNMVGCTSFAAWGDDSEDSSLIVARNFDFYVGDDFSKNKIVCFCNPDKGYKFMYVTWGGMIGVVSGMNEKGVTVTLNAAPSKWPLGSK